MFQEALKKLLNETQISYLIDLFYFLVDLDDRLQLLRSLACFSLLFPCITDN